jgi:L-threonylcarbamoyladenylate synthase
VTPPSSDPTSAAAPEITEAETLSAVQALSEGKVVGLPTETVYGLGVRADDPAALGRLAALRHEGPPAAAAGPFTWHTMAPGPLIDGASHGAIISRLASRYWPGPLTLVVHGAEGGAPEGLESLNHAGWTGVRVPSHAHTAAVLDAAPFPVAITAAALPGGTPAVTAAEAREAFSEDDVPIIIDGGSASLGTPSTVLSVGPGRFEVLRDGIVTGEELRRTAGLSILFVCTGNTCRSPMAEAIARAALQRALGSDDEAKFGFEVASAGVYAGIGSRASEHAVTVLGDRKIDLTGHRSRPAIDREVAAVDRVYCLTRSHRAALLAMLPPSAAETVELLDPAGKDVPDPFGGPLEVYQETATVIESFIEARISTWV